MFQAMKSIFRAGKHGALLMGAMVALTAGAATPAAADPAGLNLEQYRGKVVYVDFWASWCGPCRQSFGFMKGLAAQYPRNDLVILTINVDRQRAQADTFLRQVNANLPVIYDARGDLAKSYKVSDMPTSFVVDRSGRVRYRHQGFFPAKQREYQTHVADLVRER